MTDPRIQEALEAAEDLARDVSGWAKPVNELGRETIRESLDRLTTKLAAAKEALQSLEGGWQPIDSAPREGTKVQVWQSPWGAASQGYCLDGHHAAGEAEGWFTVGGHRPISPTHWMPLPTPPESDRG